MGAADTQPRLAVTEARPSASLPRGRQPGSRSLGVRVCWNALLTGPAKPSRDQTRWRPFDARRVRSGSSDGRAGGAGGCGRGGRLLPAPSAARRGAEAGAARDEVSPARGAARFPSAQGWTGSAAQPLHSPRHSAPRLRHCWDGWVLDLARMA